jgi:hypothetical protein
MDILQELLGPVSVGEFLHRHFTRVPFAMPTRAMPYTHAFTAADFAAMVEGPRSVLRVVQNGRLILTTPTCPGRRRRPSIAAAIPSSCGMPTGRAPSSRPWPRRLRSFFMPRWTSRSI